MGTRLALLGAKWHKKPFYAIPVRHTLCFQGVDDMATTKKTTTAKTPRVKKAISEKPQAALKTGTRKKRTPGKASTKLPVSFSLEPKSPVAEPVIHHDDIALRAYFIGERRQKMGWPGDSATDWADAERQLRAEALEKPLKKR